MKFILGQKLEMSQVFDKNGNVIPVTLIEAGPCQILEIKTKEKNGYQAVQIGFKKISVPLFNCGIIAFNPPKWSK